MRVDKNCNRQQWVGTIETTWVRKIERACLFRICMDWYQVFLYAKDQNYTGDHKNASHPRRRFNRKALQLVIVFAISQAWDLTQKFV